MNRRSFFRSLGVLAALPAVGKAVGTVPAVSAKVVHSEWVNMAPPSPPLLVKCVWELAPESNMLPEGSTFANWLDDAMFRDGVVSRLCTPAQIVDLDEQGNKLLGSWNVKESDLHDQTNTPIGSWSAEEIDD